MSALKSRINAATQLAITFFAVSIFFGLFSSAAAIAQQATSFEVTLDSQIASEPVSGRLLVFLAKRNPTPINGPSWFDPEPFFAVDVNDLKPGESITIDETSDSFPKPLSFIRSGKYNVQAILNHNFYQASHANGEGNFYSAPSRVEFGNGPVQLKLNKTIDAETYDDSKWVKFVTVQSKLLSDFHKREVIERAMVVLPQSYFDTPEKRYPVYYIVTGFGGTLKQLQQRWKRGQNQTTEDHAEFIRVYLTGQCKWGHHVYANSATNGPRGDCLVKETIPQVDKQFRTIPKSTARFVGGHSSGGWSSLWLQVNYPDTFGGVWSTAPDPVDFRDWQGTNIYAENANVYRDQDGRQKPLARFGGRVVSYYEEFSKMDDVLGNGGQIRSFDAVFSPKGPDGKPAFCWDRETGQVNPEVFEHWKKYDIGLILESNWSELKSSLDGKLHVYMGDVDTFYLEGATKILGQRLKDLGSNAVIEIFPDKDHRSLLDRSLRNRIASEMTKKFRQKHPDSSDSDK